VAAPLNTVAAIPVILFAYARPEHTARVLACLRGNGVPLLYVFADAAKGDADAAMVTETRALFHAIDWCEVRLVERSENFGLGRNVMAGVAEVAAEHEAFIVWEDDLVCVPGTYDWVCAALRHYANDDRVMSVTAWTHPRLTPAGLGGLPFFDARAECWVWGTWARSWTGMAEQTASEKMQTLIARGIAPDTVGGDLVSMAAVEEARNIWAVRWLYHHLQYGRLCLRPPHSMVEHIGFDSSASNAGESGGLANPPLAAAPAIPRIWPEPHEHPWARRLWRVAAPAWPSWTQRVRTRMREVTRAVVPAGLRDAWHRSRATRWAGDFPNWPAAVAASDGYDAPGILARVTTAVGAVRDGHALFERDGVAFDEPPPHWPVIDDLVALAAQQDGKLIVLDVGGGLGGLYFNYRHIWDGIPQLRWRVVEQPGFVAAGRAEFASDRLGFFESVETALAAGRPDVLLLGSVLPYIPNPHHMLRTLLAAPCRYVLVERTGIVQQTGDRLVVQHVSKRLGGGSYPCWLFSRTQLLSHFADYRLLREEVAFDGAAAGAEFLNFWFGRDLPGTL